MDEHKTKSQRIRELLEDGKSPHYISNMLNVTLQYVYNVRWHIKNKADKKKLDFYQESIASALSSMNIEMAEDFYYRRLCLHKLVVGSLAHNPEFVEPELSDPTLYRIDSAIKQDICSRAEWRLMNRPEWPPLKWPFE